MLIACLLGLLSSVSLPLGAWLSYQGPSRPLRLGIIAGFGAGALIGVAAFELIPTAEHNAGPYAAIGGFLGGAALFTVLDMLASRWLRANRFSRETRTAAALLIGALIDGLPEALALGIDLYAGLDAWLPLLAAISLSNLPESMVASGALRSADYTRATAVWIWSGVALIITALTVTGYALAAIVSPLGESWLLALAAGGIIAVAASALIPTAAKMGNHRAALSAALGVTIILILRRLSL